MKIACITVYCNEAFRVSSWKQYFSEYKDAITLHVIVNNGDKKETIFLRQSFPGSVVLESEGGNLMRAYNKGLSYVLQNTDIEAVMQITNDVKFENGAIEKLYNFLFSDDKLAVVGPVLLKKDSLIVESYGIDYTGCNHFRGGRQFFPYKGKPLKDIREEVRQTTYVPAGTIMCKRDALVIMGYQDELLNMYCDERDMFIRLKKLGFYEAVTKNAVAWHQHQNRPGMSDRSLFAPFFSSRNGIYLIHKHANCFWAWLEFFKVFIYESILVIYHLLKGELNNCKYDRAVIVGSYYGLRKNMITFPNWLND